MASQQYAVDSERSINTQDLFLHFEASLELWEGFQ